MKQTIFLWGVWARVVMAVSYAFLFWSYVIQLTMMTHSPSASSLGLTFARALPATCGTAQVHDLDQQIKYIKKVQRMKRVHVAKDRRRNGVLSFHRGKFYNASYY